MSKRSEPQSPPTARDQALAWFVRLNSGDATTEERVAFRHWQAADPARWGEGDPDASLAARVSPGAAADMRLGELRDRLAALAA